MHPGITLAARIAETWSTGTFEHNGGALATDRSRLERVTKLLGRDRRRGRTLRSGQRHPDDSRELSLVQHATRSAALDLEGLAGERSRDRTGGTTRDQPPLRGQQEERDLAAVRLARSRR